MNRLLRAALAGTLMVLVVGVTRADYIYYTNSKTKKEEKLKGKIEEENLGGIKISFTEGKKRVEKVIPAGALTRVVYETRELDNVTYNQPFVKQENALKKANRKTRTGLLLDAITGYNGLIPLLRGHRNAIRYINWKIAEATVLLAKDDPTQTEKAIKLLTEYKTAHPGGWQILPALKTLAKLQEDSGKIDDARKTYEELAEVPDVPRELKQESEILVGRLLLRTSKFKEAETKLEKLAASMSQADVQKPFVEAYLAESRISQSNPPAVAKQLQEVIRNNTDVRLRGLAYNLLGDHYRKTNKDEEAFWSYLRVDVMYNEDPEEQAKALYYLATLFDKQKKDPIRGKECSNRLQDKRFEGTAFQKLAKSSNDKKK